jgi:hypothetical protein
MADKRNIFDQEVRVGPIKETYLKVYFIGPNLTSYSNGFLLPGIILPLGEIGFFYRP